MEKTLTKQAVIYPVKQDQIAKAGAELAMTQVENPKEHDQCKKSCSTSHDKLKSGSEGEEYRSSFFAVSQIDP